MRKVKRLRERETDLDEARHHEHEGGDLDPDLRERLAAAIDALPEGLRLALVMHTIEGYTHAEVGLALGIAEGTSKARVFEARARVRKALGGGPAGGGGGAGVRSPSRWRRRWCSACSSAAYRFEVHGGPTSPRPAHPSPCRLRRRPISGGGRSYSGARRPCSRRSPPRARPARRLRPGGG